MGAVRRIRVPFVGASAPAGPTDGTLWWDTDDTSAAGSSVVESVKVTVSSAELLAIDTNPKTLVAAPGTGKFLQLLNATGFLTAGATQFDASDLLGINWGGITNPNFGLTNPILGSGWLNEASDAVAQYPAVSEQGYTPATVVNQPFILVSASAPTQGNGSVVFYITYCTRTV